MLNVCKRSRTKATTAEKLNIDWIQIVASFYFEASFWRCSITIFIRNAFLTCRPSVFLVYSIKFRYVCKFGQNWRINPNNFNAAKPNNHHTCSLHLNKYRQSDGIAKSCQVQFCCKTIFSLYQTMTCLICNELAHTHAHSLIFW